VFGIDVLEFILILNFRIQMILWIFFVVLTYIGNHFLLISLCTILILNFRLLIQVLIIHLLLLQR